MNQQEIVNYRLSRPLTENERKILQIIRGRGQVTEGEIARLVYIHRGNVRRTVNSLYVKGYVKAVEGTYPKQWSNVTGARY